MAFNIPGVPFKLTPEDMGQPRDLASSLMKGYEAAFKPRNLSEELLNKQLTNKINRPKAEDAQGWYELEKRMKDAGINATESNTGLDQYRGDLMKAQANNLNRKPAITGETAQLFALRDNYDPGSKEYEQISKIIELKGTPTSGTQLNIDPSTGAVTFSSGGRGGAGPASFQTVDSNGNPVIVSKPSGASVNAQQSQGAASAAREAVEPIAQMPYLGLGGSIGMAQDFYNYKHGSDEAGDRLAMAAAMDMFAPDIAFNQLTAMGQKNPTIPAIQHQLESIKQGWPNVTNKMVNNLPPELQKKAKEIHSMLMDTIGGARQQHAAEGYPIKLKRSVSKEEPPKKLRAEGRAFKSMAEKIKSDEKERVWDVERAKRFNVSPETILKARSEGVKSDSEMRNWLQRNK